MAKEYILKDRHGNSRTFDKETLYVRGTDGELMPFTHGTGNPVLQPLSVTENGTYTAPDGVDGYNPVTVAVSGGSSADVRYVTFMSYDGLVEYGKKAVAVGDDCADPIARGIFAKPTRESDAQYNYTFYGWANEPNGGADANWNKAVTEDKTVYANFTSSVRYYTITYYDSDGTTVLKTESLAYGSTPTYVGEKDGVGFSRWTPEPVPVTGNASYTAVWVETITFANAPWSRIVELAESGKASDYFAVGDTKELSFNGETLTVAIGDFNHDDLSDGSGKAGISLVLMSLPTLKSVWTNDTGGSLYDSSVLKTNVDSWLSYLPETLQPHVKSVNKEINASFSSNSAVKTIACKLWPLSYSELGWNGSSKYNAKCGYRYPIFPSVGGTNAPESIPAIYEKSSIGMDVTPGNWLRQTYQVGGCRPIYVTTIGNNVATEKLTTATYRVRFGFCI